MFNVYAQIVIGGHVYGGGNAGDVKGSTAVTVREGDLDRVFGGARMANVEGRAFVNIDGANASNYIVINRLYGGNDIAGTIGNGFIGKSENQLPALPTAVQAHADNNGVDKTWNALVLISSNAYTATEAAAYNNEHNLQEGDEGYVSEGDVKDTNKPIYIGQLFGGGDGEYTYGSRPGTTAEGAEGTTVYYAKEGKEEVATSKTPLSVPVLGKTFLDIHGGSIVYAYGGGNNATVTERTVISMNNPSAVVNSITDATNPNADANGELLTNDRFENKMGINTGLSYPSSGAYQIGRLFGGNNKAPMAIRPTWKLQKGKVRNIYSGGNQGAMTSPDGILLVISSDDVEADNVYGGCRMADVNPAKNNIEEEVIDGVTYPAGYAARLLITGGNINNVYGGNDVTGNIYGGNAVGIHSSINKDVYGGGNGSYPYTDNDDLINDGVYRDLYYNPGSSSVDALNAFRPNAESVSIRVVGTAAKPTVIGGALYCGGNSATLRNDTEGTDASAQLKIGSYVIADKVFLGNNGENMVTTNEEERDEVTHELIKREGTLRTMKDVNSMDLTNATIFKKYMDGVAMNVKPEVVFDKDAIEDAKSEAERDYTKTYKPYSTYFGSFYCGGNVGSMMLNGVITVNFNDKVIIYDKVVGGSNEANVYLTTYNAQYLGGLLGDPDGNGNKLILNFGGLKIQPKRWNDAKTELVWNTVDGRTYNYETKTYTPMDPVTDPTAIGEATEDDLNRRFQGGNIYGGCYSNGHVNGNVIINVNASLMDRKGDNNIFDEVEENEGEAKLYDGNYKITKRHTGVLLGEQGMDPLGRALNVFGGGYGGDSEIWGSTTINLNAGYVFQVFGGGEQGAIGEAISHEPDPNDPTVHNLKYKYNAKYSTYINLGTSASPVGTYRGDKDDSDGVVDDDDMADCEFIYGGSFEGLIAGDTHINLGNGRLFNSFAGSCNADILGHTETYVGRNSNSDTDLGFPWIRDHIYGGNDLGGRILGEVDFKNRVSADILSSVYNPTSADNPDVLKASAYTEYIQGRVEYIFGGCYGDYDYRDPHYRAYANENGTVKSDFNKPWMKNAFVNFKANNAGRNSATKVYGAGQGHTYLHVSDADRDKMQDRSYVLIDIPQNNTNFRDMEVFGAGDYSGLGMRYNTSETTIEETTIPALTPAIAKANADGVTASAVVDLMRGQVKDVYGASYKGGITRRTIVNVPKGSTINLNRIFGGGYGVTNTKPCDVYEANVNYHSAMAMAAGSPDDIVDGNQTAGGIYGGNNNCRRTLYAKINIDVPVRQNEAGNTARVFGAGYGKNTWAQYTEINLKDGASVYEVYGGGFGGMVLNKQSAAKYTTYNYEEKNETTGEMETKEGVVFQTLPEEYTTATAANGGLDGSLDSYLVNANPLDKKTNTNVNINSGAYVAGYCYGGGLGADATVSGTTYIGLHGGEVSKDMYGGGWGGAVYDKFAVKDFVAATNVFVEGGTLRNVYGGGYQGSIGYHQGATVGGKFIPIAGPTDNDILGETNVVVGIRQDQTEAKLESQLEKTVGEGATKSDYGYNHGVPAIQRNAYSGGEGGAVFGDAHLTLNNGYIGYVYLLANEMLNDEGKKVVNPNPPADAKDRYEPKIHDDTYYDGNTWAGSNRLVDYGNLFGGGYDDLSSTDKSFVTIWGGTVRGSVHGGGEIATIGRGTVTESEEDNKVRVLDAVYKFGGTSITMYNGHVLRNIFGGGKGYNINGYGMGANKLYTDGYVFGQTQVYIHGGEIGTQEGVAIQADGTGGYGNVFGGGDVGFVYGNGYFSDKTKEKIATGSPGHIYYYDAAGKLTEDCKVVISPYLQVKPGKTASYKGVDYEPYDYVPTEYLNTLPADKTDSRWTALFTGDGDSDERGIVIRNAVFAGGNVSSNSENYANAITVFGNTTATLYDVYHHDFITVGTEHTGGLYGGGNLSVVGGYRELNITNYGTDYYGLNQQITLEEYGHLTNRERAYFKLQYVCMKPYTDSNGKQYKKDDKIDEEDYNYLIDEAHQNKTYWQQYGFCSIYAGRLLNTIQRADFCGVFGSRLVLQGAKDRVADVADATAYTINRIGELSLNQQRFNLTSDDEIHGNYFGIYSVVNYLGSLTSDVHFDDPRRYIEGNDTIESTQTYYDWKREHLKNRDRNNGTSWNQVALASGVFLELTTEHSTPSKKVYGDITGVVELDLINVKKDIEGGGYVYARNEHGKRHVNNTYDQVLLSSYNKQENNVARTKMIYYYDDSPRYELQTSGNFIHKSKRIVDDCYPNNGVYNDYEKSPAHYWFIKGEVYIYDQVVSAYAGSATAYRKEVKIPLTITAGSNGKLKLLNIQPNRYAYYADGSRTSQMTSDGVTVDNERVTYHLNDVITWWDWHQLADNEKKCFVKETYINVDSCTIGGTPYPAGTFVLENDPSVHASGEKTALQTFLDSHPEVKDAKGDVVTDEGLTKLFRSSNNIGHDTGYVLTFDMNSPKDWDDWYSPISGSTYYMVNDNTVSTNRKKKDAYDALSAADKANYREGPTYTLKPTEESGLYGQRNYAVGEIITDETRNDYETTVSKMTEQPTGQATIEEAYVALASVGNMQAGNAVPKSEGEGNTNFAPAMVCTNSIQLGDEKYILMGELVPTTSLDALAQELFDYNNSKVNTDNFENVAQARDFILTNLSKAWYITSDGLYGGQYFQKGINYAALKAWCDLTESRNKFDYNYDALDVLIDPLYHGEGYTDTYYKSPYSDIKSVEYEAVYTGTGTLTYYDNKGTEHTIASGKSISREEYEEVRNDQMHYTRLQVDAAGAGDSKQTFYIVTENIINNGTPYAKGQDISERDYNSLTDENKAKVRIEDFEKGDDVVIKYYCYEDYTPTTTFSTEKGTAGALGSVISTDVFTNVAYVPNYQKAFAIQGSEPTETTTLYVSRESNAKDVMSEKVISVVYQYTYYEADDEGEGVSLVNELHVVNIHLQLESGAPEIGPLSPPPAVIPGNNVGLKAPSVNPGLYVVLNSGWELFNNEDDAVLHRNGIPFVNNGTPLYWYQNQKVFVAFYSNTYLGKTYSNYVPLTVANYHDLDAVMKDKEHHLYVDHPNVMRKSKIYIDNRDCKSDATKSELDLLKDFFDLSLLSTSPTEGALAGHATLNDRVEGGNNLEFFLNSNVSPKAYTDWTPIGNDTQCFRGNLHGDGYTVSGLNNSLFGKLCGSVYNLGVTGSFTSAGVADTGEGYVENCWTNSSATSGFQTGTRAVFGKPANDEGRQQLVNSYYLNTNTYPVTTDDGFGIARPMTETEFYNGTVAYNLNGFYLNKRYYDKKQTSGTAYKYLKEVDGVLQEEMSTGYYPAEYAFYPVTSETPTYGYVENRYADGDFIYSNGTIPQTFDERMRAVKDEKETTIVYAPIWPDDYIYFGQTLTYNYNSSRPHEDLPSHISKISGRLPISDMSNRVYRAPAYYQSSAMDVAHFNLWAYLAAYSKPETVTAAGRPAYPNMTAIDFFGHQEGTAESAYKQGLNGKLFYQPLLDADDGLLSIANNGETPNLLVYAPEKGKNAKTDEVLEYFAEPSFATYYINDDYRRVGVAPTASILGHLVESDLVATTDHLLVDKRDFNCPIGYNFADGKRMWHQRLPERYVDISKGWETVSLPFTAELVTTQDKGEITHFYDRSLSVDENGTKIGHEYWLREYKGGAVDTNDATIFKTSFNYPSGSSTDKTKNVSNTFLWDYYYKANDQQDANADIYQKYYATSRSLAAYPLLANGKPYIIGFPGKTYYEFDLSGQWKPKNTADEAPAQLEAAQTITFASYPSNEDGFPVLSIGVSDLELTGQNAANYTFMPNYSTKVVAGESYQMVATGNQFSKQTDATPVPFRPYFVGSGSSPAPSTRAVQYIFFDNDDSSFAIGDDDPSEGEIGQGGLLFGTRRHTIIVTSSLKRETDVRIVNVNGQTITSYNIQPGETIETPVYNGGVYIIRAGGGHYTKKVSVK
jgi:hypothetical protein